jgi:hypothetical protein
LELDDRAEPGPGRLVQVAPYFKALGALRDRTKRLLALDSVAGDDRGHGSNSILSGSTSQARPTPVSIVCWS